MTETIQELLDQGLDLFGRGDEEGAIIIWKKVISLDPNNAQAIDFLQSAGISVTPGGVEREPDPETVEDKDWVMGQVNDASSVAESEQPATEPVAEADPAEKTLDAIVLDLLSIGDKENS